MQVFLDHIYWYKLLLSHVLTQEQGFPFLLAKRCSRSRLRNTACKAFFFLYRPGVQTILKKAAPALGSGSPLKVGAPALQH